MNHSDFIVTNMPPFSQPQGERISVDSMLYIKAIDRKTLDFDDSGDSSGRIEIAVPSRLRINTSARLPMSGIRVAIKDNFDLEGTKTSLCSRPYLQTYLKKLKSAPCIQRLMDLGASIVGKTKLCSFAQWEEPWEESTASSNNVFVESACRRFSVFWRE